MHRRNEANVGGAFLAAGMGGAILGQAMIAAAPAIGEAVGAAIRTGINEKHARDWQAAVKRKADQAEKLLAEFDTIRRDLGGYPPLLAHAIRDQVALQRQLDTLQAESVFEAYDALVALIARIKRKLSFHRQIADIMFNATMKAKLRAKREREAA
jgi:hypothetical protein